MSLLRGVKKMKKKPSIVKQILKDKHYLRALNDNNDNFLFENYMDFIYEQTKIETALKDKEFLKLYLSRIETRLRENYLDFMYDNNDEVDLKPAAKSKTNYVGIELECFTHYDLLEMHDQILKCGLDGIVQPVGDGSISPDFGDDCELRILLPEKQLSSGLKKLGKLLKKDQFGVNDTCGLHVHLDMRNRDVEKCYERLIKFQDVLFGMVDCDRWDNEYCMYTNVHNMKQRYVAINKDDAYRQHKTIEVRLHHATLDVKRIEQWIKLLLNVISTNTPPPEPLKAEVVKWGRKQGLGSYVVKNYNDEWFEEKKLVSGGDWD
jgi:Putative amidoligase enzyme